MHIMRIPSQINRTFSMNFVLFLLPTDIITTITIFSHFPYTFTFTKWYQYAILDRGFNSDGRPSPVPVHATFMILQYGS